MLHDEHAAQPNERDGHRTVCQDCGFAYPSRCGKLGEGFIEAHHLGPISSLVEDMPVTYDPKKDFAVLCANCHRMIHRTADPSDLTSFKASLLFWDHPSRYRKAEPRIP